MKIFSVLFLNLVFIRWSLETNSLGPTLFLRGLTCFALCIFWGRKDLKSFFQESTLKGETLRFFFGGFGLFFQFLGTQGISLGTSQLLQRLDYFFVGFLNTKKLMLAVPIFLIIFFVVLETGPGFAIFLMIASALCLASSQVFQQHSARKIPEKVLAISPSLGIFALGLALIIATPARNHFSHLTVPIMSGIAMYFSYQEIHRFLKYSNVTKLLETTIIAGIPAALVDHHLFGKTLSLTPLFLGLVAFVAPIIRKNFFSNSPPQPKCRSID